MLTEFFGISIWSISYQPGVAFLIWSVEGYCRGAWTSIFLKDSAFPYVLLSVAILPCSHIISKILFGQLDFLFIIGAGLSLLSGAAGVYIVRLPGFVASDRESV